jgi:hypothetical protein
MNLTVVLVGLVLLACLALAVGGLDIHAQRAALRRIAHARRIADARRDRQTRE